jgi:predicted peptidase
MSVFLSESYRLFSAIRQRLPAVNAGWQLIAFAASVAALPTAIAQPGNSGVPAPNPDWPLYQATGEQYRVYDFPGTGEGIPYRLFVPNRWTPSVSLPVLITLRAGMSVNNNHREDNDFVLEAEERGYIVISPMGYKPLRQPYYNSPYPVVRPNGPSVPGDGWTDEEDLRAEQDVMNVLAIVAAEYNADLSRVFIHGQNPSGSGAMHLIARYPDRFRGAVISSGPIVTDDYPFEAIRGRVALMIVHGSEDTANPIEASMALAETARAAGVEATYATIPGGTHLTAYLDFAGEIFDFLDAH